MRFRSATAPGSNSTVVSPLVEEGQKTVSVPEFSPDSATRRSNSLVMSHISVLPRVLREMLPVLTGIIWFCLPFGHDHRHISSDLAFVTWSILLLCGSSFPAPDGLLAIFRAHRIQRLLQAA